MIFIMIVGLVFVVFLWTLVYRHCWDQRIALFVTFPVEAVFAGETAQLTEIIENRKKLPVPVMEVRLSLRQGLRFRDEENTSVSDNVYKRDIFSLSGMQKITRQITFTCEKRGLYEIREVQVSAFSLMYQEQYIRMFSMHPALYVYPKRVEVDDILSVSMHMLGEIAQKKYLHEDPFAFRGIREYTTLDAPKTINWKASAKTGALMVNTFDSGLRGKFMLYLDVEDDGIVRHENLIEESISVAASLLGRLLSGGMEAGVAVNQKNEENSVILPAAGAVQAVRIERMLACYNGNGDGRAFGSLLGKREEDTVYLFVSKEKERAGEIESFLGEDGMGIWIFPTGSKEDAPCAVNRKNLRLCIREVSH